MRYVTTKQSALSSERRAVERLRQDLGKQIQKLEFDLSELAGDDYFRTYQTLNKAVLQNRAAMEVQQFEKYNNTYSEQRRILTNPGARIKFEKQILVIINSPVERLAELKFSYLIAGTSWSMEYDVRASNTARTLTMVVHATISQNTGEDWNNVSLSLSTGAPVTSIRPPSFSPWLLAPETARREDEERGRAMSMEGAAGAADYASSMPRKLAEQTVQVEEKGPYIEIILPHRQSIISSRKQQKKLIAEYALDPSKLEFYYELLPEQSRTAFVRVNLTNTTALPWLPGKAQIFLENEFMGKSDIAFTPAGKKDILTLGIEPRVTASKKLVRTFEDQSGIFQNKRRILYSYQLVVDNQLRTATPVVLSDAFPVSVNDSIKVEIQNLSKPFLEDDDLKKTPEFARGKRTWKINVGANTSETITYDAVITFDKEMRVRNLR
jgi:uncharacterized protein (TIGR02231 family)